MTLALAVEPEAAAAPAPLVFADVFRENLDFVWRSVRRLGVGDDAIDDVVQEVFLVVHRRLGEFEGRSSLKSWMYGIAIRVVRNQRRAKGRRGALVEVPETLSTPEEHSPHHAALRAQASQALLEFLNALDDERRDVFIMVELEQESVVDAASALGINVNTAHGRLRAVRAEFEAFVARYRARDGWRQR